MRLSLPAMMATAMAAGVSLHGCRRPEAQILATEVRAIHTSTLPATPDDGAWQGLPVHPAKLLLQDIVEPRKLTPGTQEIRVQALWDGRSISFRLSWDDSTKDDVRAPARFADACAVQLPQVVAADVPAPTMGEAGRLVEISYWSAAAQAMVDGRADDIKALYPNAPVDHYPFAAPALSRAPEAQKEMERAYAPAKALGNVGAGRPARSVTSLIGEGAGSLVPAPTNTADGRGAHAGTGWSVVIRRPLPRGAVSGGRMQVAFAVWNGSEQDVGARKMRTAWVPLELEVERKSP